MVILTQDQRNLIITKDGDRIATSGDKSGRIMLAGSQEIIIGEYPSGYMARAVLGDLYNAMGGNGKYRMPTVGEAKRLHTGVI